MEGYESYRVKNQAEQILNYADNINLDKRNLVDVIRIYNNILDDKSYIFSESLMSSAKLLKSEYFEEYDKYITSGVALENNNSDSFLIFPMFSNNHAFYGILRKINNEYSYTVINRGDRWIHKKYEEYIIIDIEKLLRFLKEVSIQNIKRTEEIYKEILLLSKDNKLNLINVDSITQKVGNCLIKELEAAIKYAYSTRSNNENNLNLVDIRKNISSFKPKWNISNLDMHGKYINELKNEDPGLSLFLDNIYKSYAINKKIRKYKKECTLKDIINKIFIDSANPIKDFLINIDISNFVDLQKEIEVLVVGKLKDKCINLGNICNGLETKNISKLLTNEDFLELSYDFTNMSIQLKEAYANMYFKEACKLKKTNDFDKIKKLIEQALSLVPFISRAYIIRARLIEKTNIMQEKAIEDYNKAIFIEPCVSISYVEKARILELLGKYDEYEETLQKIKKLGKLTKNICRNAVDLFELKGDLDKSLKWIQFVIENIDSEDEVFIKRYENMLLKMSRLGKLTKDVCKDAINIFEKKGDLNKASMWAQVIIEMNCKPKIECKKIENNRIVDMTREPSNNKLARNSRKKGIMKI